MGRMHFKETGLCGLKLVEPFYCEDRRGYFLKAYEKNIFQEAGINTDMTEAFESCSRYGTVRGLHFQKGDFAQAKLVRVLSGEVYDVCVDIRPGSPTFGRWAGEYLSEKNHKAFYMEKGFAHGFLTMSEKALMSYLCFGEFCKAEEGGIFYDDPELCITWPIKEDMVIVQSDRDSGLPSFREFCKELGVVNK